MPGTNAGTGCPHTLRCGKCKIGRDWKSLSSINVGTRLEATGRTRDVYGRARGNTHRGRTLTYQAEYRCLSCGHIGWSRHVRMEILLKQAGVVRSK